MPALPASLQPWQAIGEALLIGFLIGIQREAEKGERHAGLRDFILVALAGGLSGLLQQAWLTVSALVCVTGIIGLFRWQHPERTGVTTELAAVATFLLAYLAAMPGEGANQTAIGLAILVAILLATKQRLDEFFTRRVAEGEFLATLRFLALIFIIYPLLPDGAYGPYAFFAPKKIWLFVILVSSISYVGYFLERYFGGERGILLTSVLGGLASTTAATSALSHEVAGEPALASTYSRAVVLANAVQFPRLLALIAVLNRDLALHSLAPFAAMTASGLVAAWLVGRSGGTPEGGKRIETRNPFRVIPALKFGALFAAILLLTKWLGAGGIYWASALGGFIDTDSIAVSLTDLLNSGQTVRQIAQWGVLIALVSNGVLKTIIAFTSGVQRFGWSLLVGFTAMFATGAALLWLL